MTMTDPQEGGNLPLVRAGEDTLVPSHESAQREGTTTMLHDPRIPRLVSITEAAEILGVVRQRVWQWIDQGRLPAARAGATLVLAESTVAEFAAGVDVRPNNAKDE